ncbi:MAG: F-box protein [Parachlamydiales bacterium]|nr:F-box protein [Parachlamydiales bacterium]
MSTVEKTNIVNKYVSTFQPINDLPDPILENILKYLALTDTIKAMLTCKRFKRISSHKSFWDNFDLKSLFPKLKIIDKLFYEKYVNLNALGFNKDQFHTIDKLKAMPILHKMFSSIPIVNDTGITLLTLPPKFCNSQFKDLLKADKINNYFIIKEIPEFNLEIHGNTLIDSYTVAITNSIVDHTAEKTIAEQLQILSQFSCRPPNFSEAALLVYLSSNEDETNWVFVDEYGLEKDSTVSRFTQVHVVLKENYVETYTVGSYSRYAEELGEYTKNYLGYSNGIVSITCSGVAAVREIN